MLHHTNLCVTVTMNHLVSLWAPVLFGLFSYDSKIISPDFYWHIQTLVHFWFYFPFWLISWAVTCLPFHAGAVSPLAGTEEVQSATPVGERRPCGWGEAERGTHAVFHPAEVLGQAKDLSGLPKGRVLVGDAAQRTVNAELHCPHIQFNGIDGDWCQTSHDCS